MFDNDMFIPHFYKLEAELQVKKKVKKSTPGKIYSFSPYPVPIKKNKTRKKQARQRYFRLRFKGKKPVLRVFQFYVFFFF